MTCDRLVAQQRSAPDKIFEREPKERTCVSWNPKPRTPGFRVKGLGFRV